MNTETAVDAAPWILLAVTHLAAIFGKPKLVQKFTVLSKIIDVIAANYGKAKNRTTDDKGAL